MLKLGGVDESDDPCQFIEVGLYDTQFTSTVLNVTPVTTASELVETISSKLDLSQEDQVFCSLVLVVSGINDAKHRSPRHCVRTLAPDDVVVEVLSDFTKKQTQRYKFTKSSAQWFFKDLRTAPIDLGDAGEVIGEESTSDDEKELSLNDLSYLSQADRKGYLLKKSSQDPNLWRKRYCVLTDKLWCISDRLRQPKAAVIDLETALIASKSPPLEFPNIVSINSDKGEFTFIASSPAEQQGWIDELASRAGQSADDDVIRMAEVIITDEESARFQRLQRTLAPLLNYEAIEPHLMAQLHLKGAIPVPISPSASSHMLAQESNEPPEWTSGAIVSLSSSYEPIPIPFEALAEMPGTMPIPRSFSSVREVRTSCLRAAEVLAFLAAVTRYKELFRHELNIPTKKLWKAVLRIIHEHLLPQLARCGILSKAGFSDVYSDGAGAGASAGAAESNLCTCGHCAASSSNSKGLRNGNVRSRSASPTSGMWTHANVISQGNGSAFSSPKRNLKEFHDENNGKDTDNEEIDGSKDAPPIRNSELTSTSTAATESNRDVWDIPVEVFVALRRAVFDSKLVSKSDPQVARRYFAVQRAKLMKLASGNQKKSVSLLSMGKLGPVPLNAVSSRFARTPAVGGDDRDSIGMLFGIDGITTSSTSSVASSSGHSFWNWTSRTLGLAAALADNSHNSSGHGSAGGSGTSKGLSGLAVSSADTEDTVYGAVQCSGSTYVILSLWKNLSPSHLSPALSLSQSPSPSPASPPSTAVLTAEDSKIGDRTGCTGTSGEGDDLKAFAEVEVAYQLTDIAIRPDAAIFDAIVEELKKSLMYKEDSTKS